MNFNSPTSSLTFTIYSENLFVFGIKLINFHLTNSTRAAESGKNFLTLRAINSHLSCRWVVEGRWKRYFISFPLRCCRCGFVEKSSGSSLRAKVYFRIEYQETNYLPSNYHTTTTKINWMVSINFKFSSQERKPIDRKMC